MKKVLMSILFAAFILTGTSFAQTTPAAAPAATAPAAAAPEAAKPAEHREHREHHEHHPELRKALRKLRGAKEDLEKAASDYDGHKAKAIEAITHAIEELKDAMGSDKK